MTQRTNQGPPATQAPSTQPPPEAPPTRATALRVADEGPMAYLMDTGKFEHMQRIASAMAASNLLPLHLQGLSKDSKLIKGTDEQIAAARANCFRVVNQAYRWGIDPFAMIDSTYEVHGKLGYEGKLIAAVINSKCVFEGGLRYVHNTKSGAEFACVAFASEYKLTSEQFDWLVAYAEDESRSDLQELTKAGVRAVRVSVLQAKTTNDMWTKDPEQKLVYNAATKWARRHAPELILGVLTEDDIDRMTAGQVPNAGELPAPTLANLTQQLKSQAIETKASGPSEPVRTRNRCARCHRDLATVEDARTNPTPEGMCWTGYAVRDPEAEADCIQAAADDPDRGEESAEDTGRMSEADAKAQEEKLREKKKAPGIVVDAVKKEEPAGGKQEGGEGFSLAAISVEAKAIVTRIGKIGTDGGLTKLLEGLTGNAKYTPAEQAAFADAAMARRLKGGEGFPQPAAT